jgi:hypothetical protein
MIHICIEDRAFLDDRLEGLSRFVNCLVRHPVIKNDPIVVTFITEQTVSLFDSSYACQTNFFCFAGIQGLEKIKSSQYE